MGIYVTDPNGKLVKVAGGFGGSSNNSNNSGSAIVDNKLDPNSVNPVQNKVITSALTEMEPSVNLVKSEIDKSKNLFDFNRISGSSGFDNETQIVNTKSGTRTTLNYLSEFADLKVGETYHIHFETSAPEFNYITLNTSLKRIDNDTTFTLTKEDLMSTVTFYGIKGENTSVSEIIIERGDKFTGYYPYATTLLRNKDSLIPYLKEQYLDAKKNIFYVQPKITRFTRQVHDYWVVNIGNMFGISGNNPNIYSISFKNNKADSSVLTIDARELGWGQYNLYEFKTDELGADFSMRINGLEPNTEYTLTFYSESAMDIIFCDVEYLSTDTVYNKSITFTTNSNGRYDFVNGFVCSTPNATALIFDIMLEKGPINTGYTYPMGRTLYALDLEKYKNTATELLESKADKTELSALANTIDTKVDAEYVNQKVADLVGAAPETLNTLEEVAAAIEENKDVANALNAAIGTKANKNDIEPTIQFAESERQKSKNLFNINGTNTPRGNVVTSINGNTITVSNSSGYGYVSYRIAVKPNTNYTISTQSVDVITSAKNAGYIGIYKGSSGQYYTELAPMNRSKTFNTNTETEMVLYLYSTAYGENTSGKAIFSGIQLEEGDVATDYQEYHGEIVRKGELAPILLWKNANINTSFAGDQYVSLIDNLANYEYFEIVFKLSSGENLGKMSYKYIYTSKTIDDYFMYSGIGPNGDRLRRVFAVLASGTSILFKSGESNGATDNSKMIPTEVYGYKGV